MEDRIKKFVWKGRIPLLVGGLAGNFPGTGLPDHFIILGIIGCGVFVGLLEVTKQKFYPTMNEESGCGIIFLLIAISIIIRQLFW